VRRHGVSRVVFCSSIAAYGSTAARQVAEETPLHPANIYAATKAAGEQLVEAYRHRDLSPAARDLGWAPRVGFAAAVAAYRDWLDASGT